MRPAGPIAVAAIALVALPLGAASAQQGGGSPSAKALECKPAKRGGALQQEQGAVRGRLGALAVLRNRSDLRTLAAAGFSLRPQGFTSVQGVGVTFASPTPPAQPGDPNVIFYTPSGSRKSVTDPDRPDFPYRLAGWGYEVPYAPSHLPSFVPCMAAADWHVHERGIYEHATGRLRVMPPSETAFGSSGGTLADPPALRPVIGFPHSRSWTAHLWLNSGGAPESATLDPTRPAPGVDPGRGSGFYDLEEPPTGVLEPSATGVPMAVDAGEGQHTQAAGGKYTVKSAAFFRGAQLTIIDAELSEGSRRPERGPLGHDEGWYLLDGGIEFKVGSQTLPASKGSFVYLPEGSNYTFKAQDGTKAVYVTASGVSPRPTRPKPYALQAGEGEEVTVGGSPYRFKATKKDTGGVFSFLEIDLQRGSEPPPHIHHKEVETFYILNGEMTFQSAGQTIPVQSGGVVQLPIGVPHSYNVTGDGKAKALLIAIPAGLEDLFRTLDKLGGKRPSAAQARPTGVEPVIPPGAGGN